MGNNWILLLVNVFIKRVLDVLWLRFFISSDDWRSNSNGLSSSVVTFHVGTERFESDEGSLEVSELVKMSNDEDEEADWEEFAAVLLLGVVFLGMVFLVVFLSVFTVFLVFLSLFLGGSLCFSSSSLGSLLLFWGISFESNSIVRSLWLSKHTFSHPVWDIFFHVRLSSFNVLVVILLLIMTISHCVHVKSEFTLTIHSFKVLVIFLDFKIFVIVLS